MNEKSSGDNHLAHEYRERRQREKHSSRYQRWCEVCPPSTERYRSLEADKRSDETKDE
ncbi:MAG TPA: hypothetical protein PLB92_03375 [Rhodoglobus sp.]|nr:hypothetical protein [Rhodoglobus sp.]HQG69505.1 hypothetical protein [Rhodoglobus sp.]